MDPYACEEASRALVMSANRLKAIRGKDPSGRRVGVRRGCDIPGSPDDILTDKEGDDGAVLSIAERAQAQADEKAIQDATRTCVRTAPEPIAAE